MNFLKNKVFSALCMGLTALCLLVIIPVETMGVPNGCKVSDVDIAAAIADGFDWNGPNARNVSLEQSSYAYEMVERYMCAGIPPEQIKINATVPADENKNGCIDAANEYPSSSNGDNTCDVACFSDPSWWPGDAAWVVGEGVCSNNKVTDKTYIFVSVAKPPTNDRCSSVNSLGVDAAKERCIAKQSAYSQWMNPIEDSCKRITYDLQDGGGLTDQWCFNYNDFKEIKRGSGNVCGNEYSSVGNGVPRGGQSSSDYVRSLNQCDTQRLSYRPDPTKAESICKPFPVYDTNGSVIAHRLCADVKGLLKKTDQEIADAEAFQLAQDKAERAAELERIRQQQQAEFDGTTFGGAEGGLVPECYKRDAQGKIVNDSGQGGICGWYDFVQLINNVINFVIWAAAIIMVIVLLLAGFKLITSQGKPDALTQAKKNMGYAIGGFCIVLFAWLLVSTFLQSFLREDFVNDDVVNLLEDQ